MKKTTKTPAAKKTSKVQYGPDHAHVDNLRKAPKAAKPLETVADQLFGDDPDAAEAYGIKLSKGAKATKKAAAAAQGADVAPAEVKAPTEATPAAKAPKAPKAAKPAADPKENKGTRIIELISRKEGATLAKIMEVTGWQKHSVRGFISTCGSKKGLTITSTKNAAGERTYQIEKA